LLQELLKPAEQEEAKEEKSTLCNAFTAKTISPTGLAIDVVRYAYASDNRHSLSVVIRPPIRVYLRQSPWLD